MVRYLGNHFSCGLNFGQWIIVDDLRDLCYYYNNFDDLCNASLSGWFFAVYKKKGSALLTVGRTFQSNIFENRSHSATTQNYTVNSGGKKGINKGENSVSQDKQGISKKPKASKINVNTSEISIDSNNCSISPDPKKTLKKSQATQYHVIVKIIIKGRKKIKINAFHVNSKTNEYFLDQDNAKEQMKDFHLSLRKVFNMICAMSCGQTNYILRL